MKPTPEPPPHADHDPRPSADNDRRNGILATTWLFFWFASYFIQKPLRDDFGISAGVDNLGVLFLVTAAIVLPANMAFSSLASRMSSTRFVPLVSHFVAFVLIVFAVLVHLVDTQSDNWVARAFYLWASLFNLFAISMFWGAMAQIFESEKAKRWYGLLSAGGTLGGVAGAATVKGVVNLESQIEILSGTGHVVALLLLAAVLFECGAFCFSRIAHSESHGSIGHGPNHSRPTSSPWIGMQRCVNSPYLMAICGFLVLYTITSSMLYLGRQFIVDEQFANDRPGRIAFLADIDLWAQSLTLVGQLLFTAAFLKSLGVARGLAFVPAITAIGFLIVGSSPTLLALAAFEVTRRVAEYSVTRPSREVLYTVVGREEKYHAKVFIDTFVYRLGDASGAGITQLLKQLGAATNTIFIAAAPIALVWMWLGLRLGKRQSTMAESQAASPAVPR